jgi:putative aldouronate transport system substrate-binding protein
MPRENPAPAETVAYLDQFYDPRIGVELYFGPVGTSLELSADGTYTVLESSDPDLTQDAWLWKHGMNDLSPVYFSEEYEEKIQLAYPDDKAEIDAVFAPYTPDETFPPFLQYTPAEIGELSVLKAEINDFATETTAQWIMNGKVDEEWDAYRRQLDLMGLERMLAIYSAAYQRFLEN